MKQLTVGVVFGGRSTEHEISRKSVMSILGALDGKYKKAVIGITKTGKWFLYTGDEALIPDGSWEASPEKRELFFAPGGLFTLENGMRVPLTIDVFFPVLHGMYGEDGTIQGFFEMLGIPYVGCGVGASSNAMDKSMTKLLVSTAGIRQAYYVLVDRYNCRELDGVIAESEKKLGYPVFVKPCRSGSSVGVVKATDRAALRAGLVNALQYDTRILIEEAIHARELECAVLSAGGKTVAEVGEVVAADEYYDYDAKYNNPASRTETKPDIPAATEAEIREKALVIFRLLDCEGLARVDFFLDRDTGEVVFNEINTLPGFTSISMYPVLAAKGGVGMPMLVEDLIDEALQKEKTC